MRTGNRLGRRNLRRRGLYSGRQGDIPVNNGGKILVKYLKKDAYFFVTVTDNGKGIEKKDQRKIFDLYYTTGKEGTGLGLSISQKIISQHNGLIDFTTSSDGTTFKIKTPFMKNYSILIIDDEKSQREILSGFLSKKGFKVYTAESGQQGLKMVKDQSIDIILSDFKMPEMTGIEILEEVSLINPEIGFVIITAYGTVENAVKAMRLGAVDYISKPVNLDELEILINRIIDKSKKTPNKVPSGTLRKCCWE